MRLVEHDQIVVGEIVEQGVGRGAGVAAVDVSRVVLDAAAEPHLAQHLEVVAGAHAQAFGLEQLALGVEQRQTLVELFLDRDDRALHAVVGRDVVGRRERRVIDDVVGDDLARQRVELADALDLVAPPLDPIAGLLVRREDLQGVARDAERAARAADLVALVLDVDQPLHRELHRDLGAAVDAEQLPLVLVGRAQAVDRRDARHDDDVVAAEQRRGGRVPEPLDLLVHRAVLLDVRVGLRHVGLGLVVVVIADEVLDGVVGEEAAELVGELGGQRLVRRHDQRRTLDPLDHVGDREGLARAGRPEERGVGVARRDGGGQLVDGQRLVAGRLELRNDAERGHVPSVGGPADTVR